MNLFTVKSNGSFLRDVFSDFATLFFPDYCLGCSSSLLKDEDVLCSKCLLDLPKTDYWLRDENPITKKFFGRLPLKHGSAFLRFRKEGIVQHLLHQLKYKNHPEVGQKLGKIFGNKLKSTNAVFDLIVPLPLHPSRQRRRGYNQSAKIAEGLSESLQIPYKEVCSRTVNTTTQTKKNRMERWENIHDVFVVKNPEQVQGKKILLVDDIITTGATLEACGQELIKAGCSELSIACIAEAQ